MDTEKNAPWKGSYGDVKFHLDYPEESMSETVLSTADRFPRLIALSCEGVKISYSLLKSKILSTAKAFSALGVKAGERVTICMPNLPQTVYALYALNYIGAIASLIHPLSAEDEIVSYLKDLGSAVLLTLDTFYEKMLRVSKKTPIKKLILSGVADELGFVKKTLYRFVNGGKKRVIKTNENVTLWDGFIKNGKRARPVRARMKKDECAVILFSGGTTGITKGIMLSSENFNAMAYQTAEMCHYPLHEKKMLAALPCFHGFGLGVCVHMMLVVGGESVLVPKFNVKDYALLIKKIRPEYLVGVPTLFEALIRTDRLDGVDLSCLLGVFSGGDTLSAELKAKVDSFLSERNASVRIREGYGMTECVSACCLTPYDKEKRGSIGLPYPDTYFCICRAGTTEKVPFGEEGEICLKGPSVMLGYYDRPDEDKIALIRHDDGDIWLHTGDLGVMDEEGFIFFKQRLKRMIVTSGYNVYPSQIENALNAHEAVRLSCVIGVRDDYKMQRVKAFIALKDGVSPSEELKNDIMDHLRERIAKYALPAEIEFRDELPKTSVGKIAYAVLEKEEAEKNLRSKT